MPRPHRRRRGGATRGWSRRAHVSRKSCRETYSSSNRGFCNISIGRSRPAGLALRAGQRGVRGAPPPGTDALPPGAGETFDSRPPSPSYSPVPSPGPSPEPEDQAPPQSGGNEGTASPSPASQSPAQHEVDNEVDNQERAIRRAIRLAARAEEHLQELFPGSVPTFDTILQWTEFFLLGDYAYKEEDEHALDRILDHFVQLAHDATASTAGSPTERHDL